jgi:hypothetical protein
MFADSEMTHVCCATDRWFTKDTACSTKRPEVSQRLVEGKIDSCCSKLFEQYIAQLRDRVWETLSEKRKSRAEGLIEERKVSRENEGL